MIPTLGNRIRHPNKDEAQHTADCSHSNNHGGSTTLPLSPIKELKRHIHTQREAKPGKEKEGIC